MFVGDAQLVQDIAAVLLVKREATTCLDQEWMEGEHAFALFAVAVKLLAEKGTSGCGFLGGEHRHCTKP